ncbi:MAG: oxygen-binding di-iron domain-containing protein [Planctomycetota bacterium]|jgi:flavorubredoxin
MDKSTMFEPYQAAADIDVVPAYFPIPGLGILPVNAFVLKAAQPVLVDTGLVPLSDEFMEKLSCVIDPGDLRWLWLTHTDQDHIGSLWRVLEAAPKLRVITTYLGIGKMSLFEPLPMDRIYLLNPGQSIDVGDRILTAIKPPSYDAPETTGFHDPKTAAFFSSDCFGALMSEPVENAAGMGVENLREGMVTWATVDAPWLQIVDKTLFAKALDRVRELSPKLILSAHLPVACEMTEELLEYLGAAPEAQPFIGPDQQALEAMLKEMIGTQL